MCFSYTFFVHAQSVPVISDGDEPELAADSLCDPPEQAGSNATVAPDAKIPLTVDSPGRKATRSRFKLAATFSFTAGIWSPHINNQCHTWGSSHVV